MRTLAPVLMLCLLACESTPSDKDPTNAGGGSDGSGGGADTVPLDTDDPATDTDPTTDTDPANQPPVFPTLSGTVDEDGTVLLDLSARDPDGDVLDYVLHAAPEHGEVLGVPPSVVYRPFPDVHGEDRFEISVSDGEGWVVAPVGITIRPINDAPSVTEVTADAILDTAQALDLEATDVDGDILEWTLTKPPERGTLEGTPPALTYTGTTLGAERIEYTVSDGRISVVLPIDLNVRTPPTPPITTNHSHRVFGGMEHAFSADQGVLVGAQDPDGTTVTAVGGLRHTDLGGQVTVEPDGSFVYTAPHVIPGSTDTVVYEVIDGQGDIGVGVLSFEIPRSAWFVDNQSTGGDGHQTSPLSTLDQVENVSRPSDIVVLLGGDGSSNGTADGLVLQPGQVLCGSLVDCVVDEMWVAGAGDLATITSPWGVVVADDTTVRGVAFADGVGIVADGVSRVRAEHLTFHRMDEPALQATDCEDLELAHLLLQESSTDGIVLDGCRDSLLSDLATSEVQGDAIVLIDALGSTVVADFGLYDTEGAAIHVEHHRADSFDLLIEQFSIQNAHTGVELQASEAEPGSRMVIARGGIRDADLGVAAYTGGVAGPLEIEVSGMTLDPTFQAAARVQTSDDSHVGLIIGQATFVSDDRTFDLSATDRSRVQLDMNGMAATGNTVLHTETHGDATTTVVGDRVQLLGGDMGTHVLLTGGGMCDLTYNGLTLEGAVAVEVEATSATSGGFVGDFTGNRADGPWRFLGRSDAPVLELAAGREGLFTDSDDGVLHERGNRTAGGVAQVEIVGQVAAVP